MYIMHSINACAGNCICTSRTVLRDGLRGRWQLPIWHCSHRRAEREVAIVHVALFSETGSEGGGNCPCGTVLIDGLRGRWQLPMWHCSQRRAQREVAIAHVALFSETGPVGGGNVLKHEIYKVYIHH